MYLSRLVAPLILTLSLLGCGGGGGGDNARNLPPVVSNTSPATIDERTNVILSVSATDPDGSIREIRWLQSQGPTVAYTQNQDTITFDVPEVTQDTEIVFLVDVVDDAGAITSINISVTIVNINRAPIAEDLQLSVTQNSQIEFNLSATDPDGDSLTYTITLQPAGGTLEVVDSASQRYRYTPSTDSLEPDSIEFTVTDGELSDTGLISIIVTATQAKSLVISEIPSLNGWDDNHWFAVVNLTEAPLQLNEFMIRTPSRGLLGTELTKDLYRKLPDISLLPNNEIYLQFDFSNKVWTPFDSNQWAIITTSQNKLRPYWGNGAFIELFHEKTLHSIDFVRLGNANNVPITGAVIDFQQQRINLSPSGLRRDLVSLFWHAINPESY